VVRSSLNYYRSYWTNNDSAPGNALMTDCLYGQMLALHHGFGWMLPQGQVAQHLAAETAYNGNPYGFTVQTGRHTPPPARGAGEAQSRRQRQLLGNKVRVLVPREPASASPLPTPVHHHTCGATPHARAQVGIDTQDDTNWQGAAPTWSYLALALGTASVDAALDPTRRATENWRSRLNDFWNLAGLTTSGDWGGENDNGQPYVTSHYGFLLPNYYLLPALTGQQTDVVGGTLTFAPRYPCPYTLPLLLAGTTGTVTCAGTAAFTVAVAFGTLSLPAGGLTISGSTYPGGAVTLAAGQSVTWGS
jgi:hypothetical protein